MKLDIAHIFSHFMRIKLQSVKEKDEHDTGLGELL